MGIRKFAVPQLEASSKIKKRLYEGSTTEATPN